MFPRWALYQPCLPNARVFTQSSIPRNSLPSKYAYQLVRLLNFAIFCWLISECHRGCGLGKRSSKEGKKKTKPNPHTRQPTTALSTCARAFAYCSLLRACQITVWARFLGPPRRVMLPYVTVVCSQILCIGPIWSSPFRPEATPTNWGVLLAAFAAR